MSPPARRTSRYSRTIRSSLRSRGLVLPSRTSLRVAEEARRTFLPVSAHARPEHLSLGRRRSISSLGRSRNSSNLSNSSSMRSLGVKPNLSGNSRKCSIMPKVTEVTVIMMVIRLCGEPDLTEMQICGRETPSETESVFGSWIRTMCVIGWTSFGSLRS